MRGSDKCQKHVEMFQGWGRHRVSQRLMGAESVRRLEKYGSRACEQASLAWAVWRRIGRHWLTEETTGVEQWL
jgi:hypothetical protein